MSSFERKFLKKTSILIAGLCSCEFIAVHCGFISHTDTISHIAILFVSMSAVAAFAWQVIVRQMGAIVRSGNAADQVDFEDRFTQLIDNMYEGVVVYDRNGISQCNRMALKTLDLTERQLRSLDKIPIAWKLTNENGAELGVNDRPSQQCFNSGTPISTIIGVNKADGSISWLRVHANPVFGDRAARDRRSGKPPQVAMVVATFKDITAERESLQRFELAMKAVKFGVWDLDLNSGQLTWDENMYQIYGGETSQTRINLDAFYESIVSEDRERVRRSFELSLLECRDNSQEFRIQRQDGVIRAIRTESKGFYSRDGRALRHVGVNWDVTEQREQELRVLHASKMSSLGEMSAGIAHEINNPLAILIGKAEAIRTAIQSDQIGQTGQFGASTREAMFRHIDVVEKTVNRIAKIVKSLRSFSRDGHRDPFKPTGISEIVNEALALCHSRFVNYNIKLTVTDMTNDVVIDARSVEVTQVILNLLNNAFDAVIVLEEKWVSVDVSSLDTEVEISVTDSGRGIPPDVRAKMTQPFFTTKEVGAGTGLGLSIATGIVQSHSGTLSVDVTCPNTRIVVRIPKSQSGQPDSGAA